LTRQRFLLIFFEKQSIIAAMPRGGPRPNSGRKRGVPNKANQEKVHRAHIVEQIAAENRNVVFLPRAEYAAADSRPQQACHCGALWIALIRADN
jgi:hypothetical protein